MLITRTITIIIIIIYPTVFLSPYLTISLVHICIYICSGLLLSFVLVITKWLLVGKLSSGYYTRNGWLDNRMWFLHTMEESWFFKCFNQLFSGTMFGVWYYRLLGAELGRRVFIARPLRAAEADLYDISNMVWCGDSYIACSTIKGEEFIICDI